MVMTYRCGLSVGALLLGLASFGLVGCGDDDAAPVGAATCSGAGCACDPSNDCDCTTGDDCKVTCERCSLSCEGSAKCNAQGTSAIAVECQEKSECKGNGGDGSTLTCRDSAKCELKAGADSLAICMDSTDCKINLGRGSTVECMDSAHCNIKCDAGDCEVACSPNTQCALDCGEEGATKPGTECSDGRLICGTDC